MEANRQESEARRRELGRLERLEQARVPWANRNRAREQAVAVEFAQNFPVNGLERLEALHKELDTNRQDQQQREMETTRLAEQLGRLTPDATVLAQQEAIEALAGERAHLAAALNDYPAAKSDLDQAQTEFAAQTAGTGAGLGRTPAGGGGYLGAGAPAGGRVRPAAGGGGAAPVRRPGPRSGP